MHNCRLCMILEAVRSLSQTVEEEQPTTYAPFTCVDIDTDSHHT